MDRPYFFAKKAGTEFTIRGRESCLLGHKIRGSRVKPDGIFVQWNWNGKELEIENDRYGFYPVYYSVFDNQICISPSIARIVSEGAPVDLNLDALAVFFELGYFIGDDTPFRHIHALPPNADFRWDGKLTGTSGPNYNGKAESEISRDDAIDCYIDLFSKSISKRLPADRNFAVPLSGGRDSRHILLELNKQGYTPKIVVTAQNFPSKQTEDVEIAAMLTKEMGLKHVVLYQEETWFQAELKKNVLTNLCTDEHAWLMAVAEYLQKRVHTVYDGIAGDSLSESNFLTRDRTSMFKCGNLKNLANEFINRAPVSRGFTARALQSFLTPDLANQINRQRAEGHLIKELEKHADAPNPVNSFTLWNRGRREIALVPYSLLGNISSVYAPYLDHDLFDFLTRLPVDLLLEQNFHSDTIRRAYPDYAHIPFEKKIRYKGDWDENLVYAAFGKELTRYLLMKRPSRFMRNILLRSAMMPAMISNRYASFTRRFTTLALYLQQLDSLSRK